MGRALGAWSRTGGRRPEGQAAYAEEVARYRVVVADEFRVEAIAVEEALVAALGPPVDAAEVERLTPLAAQARWRAALFA